MATTYWLGTADPVAQVWTASIDSVDGTPADNTFTVTIGGVDISQVGDTDVGTTAAALVALLNASTHPYFAAVTWSNPSAGNIVGTADTAGVPFVAALTETGAGTGAVTDFAVTTANAGPNDWSSAANWSGPAVPANGDDVIIDSGNVNICWGLDQASLALASLTVKRSYTGLIGLRSTEFATTADGATFSAQGKPEYRQHYLKLGYDRADLGESFGAGTVTGSRRIKIHNTKAGASVTTVFGTASSSADTGKEAVRLLIDNANGEVFVRSAPAGVGIGTDEPGETSSVALVANSDVSNESRVQVGPGVTITAFSQIGGTNVLQAAATITTVTVEGGTLTTEGDYTITTLQSRGGQVFANHIKTAGSAITTANVGGVLNGQRSSEGRTWATVNLLAGGQLVGSDAITITTLNEPGDRYTLSAR